ncbi:Phytocyanin domain [Arabidopsis thaliana x Arabidopsis arenosa]|uniref:Phytocyanin domain n=1 Tax=Arabidopsis thaliana x Arabidopsis arenosa TaxID=1240361 RepID=A0A8T1YVS4_9BRAS|nr:Phytocyanin domain [Arabidopsis thaliana x Arabidopsis arenosa]
MFLWLVIVLTISVSVSSHEHKLNWVVPPANSSESFNDWASNKRFQVRDIIQFKYRKDSVMQVTKGSYKQCNSSHPRFYSNTGKTRFMFDHSVPYYFISGTSGHCEKGQKMIVEVISLDQTTTSSAPPAALAVLLCLFSLSLSFVA